MESMNSFDRGKMDENKMLKAFEMLNNRLKDAGVNGEICLFGGAVFCLVFKSRETTHDIDAIFNPKNDIKFYANLVGEELNLDKDWFNDRVKGFVSENNKIELFKSYSNLVIYNATAEYLFAMKCLSARIQNQNEINDIKFSINKLNIRTLKEAENIIYRFYPINRILPKTFYLIEELLGE